jgi:hypothetical protein
VIGCRQRLYGEFKRRCLEWVDFSVQKLAHHIRTLKIKRYQSTTDDEKIILMTEGGYQIQHKAGL